MDENGSPTIDDCPKCGDNKLRGFDDYRWIVCWTCEWTIDKRAWVQAWNSEESE